MAMANRLKFELPSPEHVLPPDGRLPDTAPISDIEPIRLVSCLDLSQFEIERIVEQPLVPACADLWRKNVTTTLSSANRFDLEFGQGILAIEYGLLSEENQHVAEILGMVRGFSQIANRQTFQTVGISIPIDWMDTVGSITERALMIADQFKRQPDRFPTDPTGTG